MVFVQNQIDIFIGPSKPEESHVPYNNKTRTEDTLGRRRVADTNMLSAAGRQCSQLTKGSVMTGSREWTNP